MLTLRELAWRLKITLSRVTRWYDVCHSKSTIRGLRYLVGMLLQLLSSGTTFGDILAAPSFATRLSQIKRSEPA